MEDWLSAAQRAPSVLVTVAIVEGSVPREPGAKMLVTRDGFAGTIGGGHLEHRAIELARAMLEGGGAARLERFALGPSLGQCCGGIAHLAFEFVDPEQAVLLDNRRNEDSWRVVPLDDIPVGWTGCPSTRSPDAGAAAQSDASDVRGAGMGENDAVNVSMPVERVDGGAVHPTWALLDGAGGQIAGAAVPACDRTRGTHVFLDPSGRRWLVDAVLAPRAHLMLFGAGHVGAAIMRALAELPCRVTWVDEREDMFPPASALPANVTVEATDTPEALVAQAAPGTTFLVLTHSHALDLRLSFAILSRPGRDANRADWFGLIGSNTKRRQFEHRLRERGIDAARLDAMVCPIGLPGITGKAPAVIAIAVAAQLLTVWESACADQPGPLDASSESN
ncbi:xanthine dehydrogenase accessory protein XdhC [Massilia sp.]|uniref:xanthine dehydrogenase accessory protein XdhC n=1 Tax=Massilia sp. TaxID=1882437 RepID=UPI0028AD2714|nr:xanthine dehydrogenase accessory protein XdhC [Massilia sp.]